ncbi:hypothetical protein E2562_012237 [Oryza meyeriana var. granulata]|uniref:Uncharacterized protein n=1 Tax=Oryza meyeriana var. granulata TaxID=110450 RepID=A0A6G1D2M9_9ORYZ|nr:hypothetical protein E2562_012237 [Oryza meyeriana var. granulata]
MATLRHPPPCRLPLPLPLPRRCRCAAVCLLHPRCYGARVPLAPPRRRRDLARPRAAADSAAEGYVTALSEVALENGTLEVTVSDLEKLEKIFAEESVAEFFHNPTVPWDEKAQLIDEIAKLSEL